VSNVLKIISYVINVGVGLICLRMAQYNILGKKIFPEHEKIIGKRWEEIEQNTKELLLAFMRLIGMGFLIVAILMILYPLAMIFYPSDIVKFAFPIIGVLYALGLFYINYMLCKKTKGTTPWKESLYMSVLLCLSIVLSML